MSRSSTRYETRQPRFACDIRCRPAETMSAPHISHHKLMTLFIMENLHKQTECMRKGTLLLFSRFNIYYYYLAHAKAKYGYTQLLQ